MSFSVSFSLNALRTYAARCDGTDVRYYYMMTEWEKRSVKDMLKHKKKIMNSVCLENRSKSPPSDAKLPAKTTC